MLQKILFTLFAGLVLSLMVNTSYAEGITKEQGDAIYQELRKIRLLLEQNNAANLKRKSPAPGSAALARINVKGATVIGNPDAPITLVEFTDYQCPYCYKFFKDTYPQLKEKYIDTGKLSLIIKDLPLSIHPDARKAAQATRCAGDQGKFLEMHDILYKNSKRLAQAYLLQYAREISLDASLFESCLASEKHLADIDKEAAEAQREGIRGTPTFVLGQTNKDVIVGTRMVGAKSIQDFDQQIQKQLAINKNKP